MEQRKVNCLSSVRRLYQSALFRTGLFFFGDRRCSGGRNRRFVVQVTGYGSMGERWLVDRYNIRQSMRYDANGLSQQIDPASYPEDWDLLLTDVFNKAWPLAWIDTVYAADGVAVDSAVRMV